MSDPLGIKKYSRKTSHVKLVKQIRLIREDWPTQPVRLWRQRTVSAQAQCGFIIRKVKGILESLDLYGDLQHQYIAYAEALAKSQDTLKFMVDLIRQHQILRDRFERRGLDHAALDAIDAQVIYRTSNR